MTIRNVPTLALLMVLSACSIYPRMEVRHTVPDDGPLSRLVVGLWMNGEKDLQHRVEALITQSPQQRPADLEALGFSCSPEPAVLCGHASQFRYRIAPAPARPEGTLDLKISARQEAGGWRVEVAKTER